MASAEHPTLFDFSQLEKMRALMRRRYSSNVVMRFWQQVTMQAACACHPWEERCTGWAQALNNGYGAFSYRGHSVNAHRFFYDALYGPLSRKQFVLHTPPCLIRACFSG
jgi:hypothetical protein